MVYKISMYTLGNKIQPGLINLTIFFMRQAKRLFSKNKSKSIQYQPSSVFKSKLMRDLPDDSSKNTLGPGQYDISLPIVKPKFEAIRKNNNTIIIKVNEKHTPAFRSLEPRFRSPKILKQHENDEQANILEYQRSKSQVEKKNSHHKQIQEGMKNRIKRLSQILNYEQESVRKNLLMDIRKSNDSERLSKVEGSTETINSLKLYKKERQRLHFLLKHMKPNSNSKGVEWSKYRETKGNLYSINNVPGPGTYKNQQFNSTKSRYYDTIDDKSWQFKSSTRRGYYASTQEKHYEVCLTRNRFISDINGKFYKVDSIPLMHEQNLSKIETNDQEDI